MSTIGPVKAFSTTIASLVASSDAVDLAGGYKKIMLEIPTMASATDVFVRASDTKDGTFRPIYHESVAATVTPTSVNFDSSVTNCFVPLNISAQYVQVALTSATTETSNTFKFICST